MVHDCKSSSDEMVKRNTPVPRKGWAHSFEFTLATVGYVVGLGNIWRFAAVAYTNGGGAFLFAYWICGATLGMVLFSIESSVGQFGRIGPLKAWGFIPIFTGIGLSSFLLASTQNTYYCVIIAWAIFYFVKSFAAVVPWARCDGSWNSELCNLSYVSSCVDLGNDHLAANGSCFSLSTEGSRELVAIYNRTMAASYGVKSVLPAEEYFYGAALAETPGTNLENLGGVNVPMFLITLLAHLGLFVLYIFGVRGFGKVVYVTTLLPYVGLSLLLLNGFFIDGGTTGMKAFVVPDLVRLTHPDVWQNACIQLFYSLGPVWGGLIGLSTFNKFSDNVVRSTLIVVIADTFTSTLSGIIIFAYLGHLSYTMELPLEEVTASGPGLVFVMYPTALASLPGAPVWSALFFFTFTIVGISCSIGSHFTFIENIIEVFPKFGLSKGRRIATIAVYLSFFVAASTPFVTQGGLYFLTFVDNFVGGWHLLFIATCEVICVAWCLGWTKYRAALGRMMPWLLEWRVMLMGYGGMVRFFIPPLLIILIASKITDEVSMEFRGSTFPTWSLPLSHILRVVMILPILLGAGYSLCTHRNSLHQAAQPIGVWNNADREPATSSEDTPTQLNTQLNHNLDGQFMLVR